VVVLFFAIAYAISWASFQILHGPSVFTLGPLLAALLLAAVTGGGTRLGMLASRMLRWRIRPIWMAAAFLVPLTIGLATVAATLALGARFATPVTTGPWYRSLLLFGMLLITGDTLFEETGWRGFALPEFSARRSRLMNSLILGVLLAGWHLPIALSESTAVVPYLVATITSAVVTNFVYYHGRESGLTAWIYHTSANTVGQFFLPMFSEPDRVTYFWALAGVNVVATVAIVVATGREFGLPRRTATID